MDSLSEHWKKQLISALKRFPTLYSEGLWTVDIEPIYLEIKESATHKYSKAYPIPKAFEKLTKNECVSFCGIGILEEANHSQ